MDSKKAVAPLGTLEYALLGLLADTPMNGYDLQKLFEMGLSNAWSASHSQIYPALGRLEGAGFIEIRETGTRGSKIYGATEAGVASMRAWLLTGGPRTMRNETALRHYFYWMLDPADAAERLRTEEAQHREHLTRYRSIVSLFPEHPDHATRWSRIMLERGMRSEQMLIDWLAWSANELERAAEDGC